MSLSIGIGLGMGRSGGTSTPTAQLTALVASLGGYIFQPGQQTYSDTSGSGTVPAVDDSVIARMRSLAVTDLAYQDTTANMPILRKDFNNGPLVSDTGETWSFVGSGIRWDSSGVPYFDAPGVSGNYASTPNAVANQITGDLCVVAKLYVTNTSSNFTIIDKFGASGNYGYAVYLNTSGKPVFAHTTNGSTIGYQPADNALPLNTLTWLRVKRTSSTGAIVFETSSDGIVWGQNGVTKTGLTGALYLSTDAVDIGRGFAGDTGAGRIYYAAIYTNADGTGTPAVEFDPTNVYRPTEYWAEYDGVNDHLITGITTPSSGYMCVVANQTEALGDGNTLCGAASTSTPIAGVFLRIEATGKVRHTRVAPDGSSVSVDTTGVITVGTPFIADASWTTASSRSGLNGVSSTSPVAKDASSSQILLIGANNTHATPGSVTASGLFQGNIAAVVFIPNVTLPEATEQQIRQLMGQIYGIETL